MTSTSLKSRIVYFVKNEQSEVLKLLVANNSQSREGKFLNRSSATNHHITFTFQGKTQLLNLDYEAKLEIQCQEETTKILLSTQENNKITHTLEELARKDQEEDEEDQYSDEEDSDLSLDLERAPMKREEEHLKQEYIHYEEGESSNPNQQHRGRGRPKGAKNKKTLQRESLQMKEGHNEHKVSLSGSKRGKGRPKGSKNKVKDFTQSIKHETGTETMLFGKRGKGRPKGSKNKIKVSAPLLMGLEGEKRKGRPPGSKNRAHSIESIQEDEELEEELVRVEISRPECTEMSPGECCVKCDQSHTKRLILGCKTNVEENMESLRNVWEDVSLENKGNLIITAIRLGDWESLEELLSIVDRDCSYHIPPWKVEHMIQRGTFETRTRKEFLSKTGKEGNLSLLHDSKSRRIVWWKELTLDRILSALPKEQPEAEQVLQRLMASDAQLKAEILRNVATVVRNGNYSASEVLLREWALSTEGYSEFHYDLLVGNIPQLNHLKKASLIQRNPSHNFCCPIHAASISENSDFLRKLLRIFTDVINVEDSLKRKPIHYASLCLNNENLSTLVENGADLRDFDSHRMTPLMLASLEGLFYNVEYILEKVRDPNYINFKSEEGYTALHYAILQNNIECLELLLNDPYVDLWALTKDKGDVFHLLAGTGNTEIMDLVLKKDMLPHISQDKFKRTPAMMAIRNNNNDCLIKLLENGCRIDRADSSCNTLLHYAAAYGNLEAILILRDKQEQLKNKKGLYPWEIAIYKGHLGAAKLLEPDQPFDFLEDPLCFALSNIRGTPEYIQCIRYIKDKMMGDIDYQQKNNGNGYLHLVCQANQQEYTRTRREETHLEPEQILDEFVWVQQQLIHMFAVEECLDGYQPNYFAETPLKLCIQNHNLIGIQKLLTKKITFEPDPSSDHTILHCLSSLASRGLEQLKFVEKKLKQCSHHELKIQVKRIDHLGFDFLLYLVKVFSENAPASFRRSMKKHLEILRSKKEVKYKSGSIEGEAQRRAMEDFVKFEDKFLHLVDFLVELGCDLNSHVMDRKGQGCQKQFGKWGIQHFLMNFPSLRLLRYFLPRIRDLNSSNVQLMTPLHIFCKKNKKGCFLGTRMAGNEDYLAEKALSFLLQRGLNPNCEDSTKSLAILYAAEKGEFEFMIRLLRAGSEVNVCNMRNQSALRLVVRQGEWFSKRQVEELLQAGMDPNFKDMDRRTGLHHLVSSSSNVDGRGQLLKVLLEHGCKVNALDKFERSPLFYCFCSLEEEENALEKMEMLQLLIRHRDVNLNLVDVYGRTILHYACEQNHFFSILLLLDKNINIEAKDLQENTPLAITLLTKNLDQASLLISKGVRYGFVNQDQRLSYFAYAYRKLSAGICFMLLDNGYPIQKALEQIPDSGFKQTLIQKYILK